MSKINLIPAPWEAVVNNKGHLLDAAEGGMEFTVADASSRWNGATTTLRELRDAGYTHAQIRYGKNNTKVWYGSIEQ